MSDRVEDGNRKYQISQRRVEKRGYVLVAQITFFSIKQSKTKLTEIQHRNSNFPESITIVNVFNFFSNLRTVMVSGKTHFS